MRHQKRRIKLGRTSQHRDLMLANLVASLIIHKRIKTTLAKAKAARPLAEKLVTLGKTATLHSRRLAIAKIGQRDVVSKLFAEIAPNFKDRQGGYTRIIKLGPRQSDSAPVAFLEWVEFDSAVVPKETKSETPSTDKPVEEETVTEPTVTEETVEETKSEEPLAEEPKVEESSVEEKKEPEKAD